MSRLLAPTRPPAAAELELPPQRPALLCWHMGPSPPEESCARRLEAAAGCDGRPWLAGVVCASCGEGKPPAGGMKAGGSNGKLGGDDSGSGSGNEAGDGNAEGSVEGSREEEGEGSKLELEGEELGNGS